MKCIVWLFGKGASIECNLHFEVKETWKSLDREEQIKLIKEALTIEMNKPEIDTTVYRNFLSLLANHTVHPWRHRFLTTNWDYLLQREIANQHLHYLPRWLENSHVFHLNGSIEPLPDVSNRSPFLLETDPPEARTPSIEANISFGQAIWDSMFVIVGMSFKCEMDRYFLRQLYKVQDDLPIGESSWVIVNNNEKDLNFVREQVQSALPRANIKLVQLSFKEWIEKEMPELKERRIFKNLGSSPNQLL